ncbi:MFS transporter [Streptomyces sp. NPDC050658]|uniref:MFS transporter n=1 Tax=unclassified Streptomyces TaxID=2593676 RepID=UPI003435B930
MTTDSGSDTRLEHEVTPPAAAQRAPGWGALAIVMVGTFITVLDYFITNVAVPTIQADLGANHAQSQLVIVGYGVAFTAGMITGGRLGDLYGRRRMFSLGMLGFTIASGLCAIAQSPDALIAYRVLQGAAAALMVPQVLGILGVVYTGAARARAFVVYGLVVGLAGVFGQVIGGALISVDVAGLDWRTIFLINLPVGVIALALTPRLIPESRSPEGGSLDLAGALLSTVTLVAVVYSLIQGQEEDWPLWSWLLLAASLPLGAAFVAHQRRRTRQGLSPLIDLAIFSSRTFSVGLAGMLSYFLAMGSFFFLLALYLQQGRGLSPAEAGWVFLTLGGGYFGSSMLSTKLAARLGHRLYSAGPLTLAVGYVLTGLTANWLGSDGSIFWIIPPLVLAGIGMGMTTGPLTGAVLAGADPQHAAAASGTANTVQEGGVAIGVALVGAVFFPALEDSPGDYPHAFGMGLIPLVACCLAAGVIVRFMRPRAQR